MTRPALALLFVPALLLTACPDAPDPRVVDHVLSRIGYGPDPWSRERANTLGVKGYIEEQLHPETIPDPELDAILAPYGTLSMDVHQLRVYDQGDHTVSALTELEQAKVLRAVYSRRQLEQVLTDFWFDHFNVDAGDGVASWSVNDYERQAIRAHVLGRFEDMLVATARHPAMLDYLDNAYSKKDRIDSKGNVIKGLNENYGRESMELHTLGVDGGYTQEDVIVVARALTGWTIDRDYETDGFYFNANNHDSDPKTLMGTLQLPANNGEQDGYAVLHFLAQHPMTAERVSRLLVERFVDESPPPLLVMAAAQKYLETDGDLREVMRVILDSPDFLGFEHERAKVKRPLVLMASLYRAAGVDLATVLDRGVRDVESLGEDLFEAKPPTGYPDESAAWAGSGALLARFNMVESYARNAASRGITWGVSDGTPEMLVTMLAFELLPGRLSAPWMLGPSRQASVDFVNSLPGNTSMAKKIDQTGGMILATPEFLLH